MAYIVYVLLAILLTIWFLPSVLPSFLSSKFQNGNVDQSKSMRIGTWDTLKLLYCMVASPRVPNYEFYDIFLRKLRRKMIIFNLPFLKEDMIPLVDLTLAKQIMSSSQWFSRFRDNYYLFKCTFNKPHGILFGGGDYWREARSFTLRILHELKFFSSENLEKLVYQEVEDVLRNIDRMIRNNGGETVFSPHRAFQVNALNLVSRIGWSQKYTQDDYFVTHIMGAADRMNRCFNVGFGILEIFPWLTILPNLTFYGPFKEATEVTVKYFQDILAQRRIEGMYKTSPKDFTDHFLLEIDKGSVPSIINDEAYCVVMRDILWGGMDTSNTALEHGLLQMALQPRLQEHVQNEVDEVLGPCRSPSYSDRVRMPYTQAVLLEILRYSSPVPISARCALVDTKLGNDHIPKGSLCGINIYSIHRCEKIWKEPSAFRPERFLSSNGDVINAQKIMPFGFGKRTCIGESVAKTFMFVLFVSLMQRYTFQLSSEHPQPSLKNLPGLSRCPAPYFLKVKRRRE